MSASAYDAITGLAIPKHGHLMYGSDYGSPALAYPIKVNSSGILQTSAGGGGGSGTEYTEGDTDASITGTAMLMEGAADTLLPVQGTVADGLLVNLGANNDVTISSVTPDLMLGTDFSNVFGTSTITSGGGVDNLTNSVTGIFTYNLPYWFDGSTWDRARGDSTDGLLVNLGSNNDVTNAGTFAVQAAQSGTWTVQLGSSSVAVKSDDAAFTPGTTMVMMAGFEYDDTATDSVDEGDAGAARMSANRNIYTTIRDAAGNERGVNVNASNQLSVSVDNTVTVASHAVTNAGTFAVQVDGAALTALQLIDDTVFAEDAGHTTGDKGIQMLAVRQDTPSNLSGTDGDYEPLHQSAGRLWVSATVTAISAGSNKIGAVEIHGSGGSTAAEVLTQGGDGTSNANNQLVVAAMGYTFNGTTYDRVLAIVTGTNSTGTGIQAVGLVGQFDDVAPQAITENQFGNLRMSANRNLYGTIRDAAGNERGANVNASNQLSVSVDNTVTVASHAVTNAGTFAVQVDGAALTSLQLIDDTVFAEDVAAQAADKGIAVLAVRRDADTSLVGTDNDYANLQVDANGYLKVEIFDGGGSHTVDNGGTFVVQENGAALTALQLIDDTVYTDDTSTHATGTSKGLLFMAAATPTDGSVNANDIAAVAMTTDRKLHVSVQDALPAGTNAIGKLAANSGVDIGDVDVLSIIPGTGATNLGKAEDAGHTTGDTGIYNLGVRNDTPNTALSNADADYSSLTTDRVGGIRTALYETDFAVLGTNHVKKYYTNAGAVTDGIIWSPAAGKRWYVTDIFINVSAAATVTLEDDKAGGDEAVWKAELAANSGWSHHYGTPLFSGEDAADLIITTSAGNVYVTVTGYEI